MPRPRSSWRSWPASRERWCDQRGERVDAGHDGRVTVVEVLDEQPPEERRDAVGGRVEIRADRQIRRAGEDRTPAVAPRAFEGVPDDTGVVVAEHRLPLHEAQEL